MFEKSILLKYIQDHGTDPINNEPLTEQDVIQIQSSTMIYINFYSIYIDDRFVKPRTPAASSIPNLLLTLQNEWDAVMLETYSLKKQYESVRMELSNALYENDAARRVIARLVKERDEARSTLASFKPTQI